MTLPACIVCDAAPLRPHWRILLRCAQCGFLTAPPDAGFDPSVLYGEDYFTGREYAHYAADESFMRRNFQRRLKDVLRWKQSGRLLEIGAAYGFFLDMARRHFDVVGFEIGREAAQYARRQFGLEVYAEEFLTAADRLREPFDVVVLWDVIEHLERPDLYIERISRLCSPGAVLFVTTGDAGSAVARWRGPKWRMIHPPTHLHYFSRSTLSRLLARHCFETIEIKTVGMARSFRQMLYVILALRMRKEALYERLKPWIPPTWGITINTFDIIQLVARKRG